MFKFTDSIILIAVAPTPNCKSKNQPILDKDSNPVLRFQSSCHNAASTLSDDHMSRLLDNVFNSLVLLTGKIIYLSLVIKLADNLS